MTETAQEVKEAWQDHNARVFQGTIIDRSALRQAPPAQLDVSSEFDVGEVATQNAYRRLGTNKGVGYDRIPAGLLQAGGAALACKYSTVNERIRANAAWPSQWRGGRSQDLFKKKSETKEPDAYWNLLLADDASKGLTSMIKEAIDQPHSRNMPDCQYGAMPNRGTDMASHLVQSLIDYAALSSLSILVLFVDFIKAFDRVVRQLMYGWGNISEDSRYEFLIDLGLAPVAATSSNSGGRIQLHAH